LLAETRQWRFNQLAVIFPNPQVCWIWTPYKVQTTFFRAELKLKEATKESSDFSSLKSAMKPRLGKRPANFFPLGVTAAR